MSLQRLVISNNTTGLETDLTPFNIKNDAFPVLTDFYIWRGKVLRKRGDSFLARFRRDLETVSLGNTGASPWSFNVYSTVVPAITGEPDAQIVPGSVVITISVGPIIFTDQGNGTLTSPTPGNSGTINYSTGAIVLTHTAGAGVATTIEFSYFPALVGLGLEDFNVGNSPQPILIGFDQKYSYGFDQGLNQFYDVTFYKVTGLPFVWNGPNYAQFWTANYEGLNTILNSATPTGCLWATNAEPGFHFLLGTYTAGTGTATWNITFTDPSAAPFQTLQVGDILWFNEWSGSFSATPATTDVNGSSGTVSAIVNAALGQYQVTFSTAKNIVGTFTGISQMLTNFLPNEDGIRWYDGDPNVTSTQGWVNFAPPLSAYNPVTNPTPQYLVGARLIIPFKNRLLFGSVYLRTSATSPGAQLFPNRVVYSQVGTPFYTLPLPVDLTGQLPQVEAWYQNVAGRGGFIGAPIDDQIVSWGENEDILITLFETQPLKLIFTSNDTLPFVFQTISAELGSISTFAAIKLDTGMLSIGSYGFTMTTSTSVQRIDPQIPDAVFDISQIANKSHRITAIRDYQKEYVYFTFCPSNRTSLTFNSRTLLYNYRENNWATFEENYSTYGTLRRTTNRTWSNIGQIYPTWAEWTDPWDFGLTNAFQPVIIGANQQGFVMQRGLGTSEQPSRFIQNINTGVVPNTITSPDHGLITGDFIEISGMIGSTNLNGTIQQINVINSDTLSINDVFTGIYLGGGVFSKLSRPFLQTKQFPIYWNEGRQVRVGTTRLLLEATSFPEEGDEPPQVTVNMYASQNAMTASNEPNVQPYLAFSNIMLTCPEIDTTFGAGQSQIWHRFSPSFNGDTIQLGITLSDAQMRDQNINQQEIILHAIVFDLYKGPVLS